MRTTARRRSARLCDRAGIDIVWLADRQRPRCRAVARLDDAVGDDGRGHARTGAARAAGRYRRTVGPARGRDQPAFTRRRRATGSSGMPGGQPHGASTTVEPRLRRSVVIRRSRRSPGCARCRRRRRAARVAPGRPRDRGRRGQGRGHRGRPRPIELGVAATPAGVDRPHAGRGRRPSRRGPGLHARRRPGQVGIFGTLEECQDRVIALAHAGITDLRCIVPATLDVHDVIAQLTAITVGTTDVLVPGSLRSPAPPPPDGWGGRSPVPDRPRVSGGSRRR